MPWQWINKFTGTVTTELAAVQGTKPPCFKCGRELGKKLSVPHFHTAPDLISFWTLRCPDCRQSHIIFNSPKFLPKLARSEDPFAPQKPPTDDPNQQKLF